MRDCGDCVACCVFQVPAEGFEIKPCPYVTHDDTLFTGKGCNNCTVYDIRPEVCRHFRCDYILGKTDERPNIKNSEWMLNFRENGIVKGFPDIFGAWEENSELSLFDAWRRNFASKEKADDAGDAPRRAGKVDDS